MKRADDLKALFKRLTKDYKPQPMQKQEALKALVRAAMSYDVSDAKADEAMRHIDKEFVDLNELRVATDLEIAELLGVRYANIEKRVEMITRALNAIFEKEHTLSLERMAALSKRDIRQFLRDIAQLHPFVEAYVMLFAFEGHCVPMDDEILAYLRSQGVVDAKTTLLEAQRLVEHHLKAEECYDFYMAVRQAAHETGDRDAAAGKKKKVK